MSSYRTLLVGMAIGGLSWTVAYFLSDLQQFDHQLRFHLSSAAGAFSMLIYFLLEQHQEVVHNRRLFDIADAQLVSVSALVDEQAVRIENLEKKIEELIDEVCELKRDS